MLAAVAEKCSKQIAVILIDQTVTGKMDERPPLAAGAFCSVASSKRTDIGSVVSKDAEISAIPALNSVVPAPRALRDRRRATVDVEPASPAEVGSRS
jgi:hypothetical protein